jgi:hypothetical protein
VEFLSIVDTRISSLFKYRKKLFLFKFKFMTGSSNSSVLLNSKNTHKFIYFLYYIKKKNLSCCIRRHANNIKKNLTLNTKNVYFTIARNNITINQHYSLPLIINIHERIQVIRCNILRILYKERLI